MAKGKKPVQKAKPKAAAKKAAPKKASAKPGKKPIKLAVVKAKKSSPAKKSLPSKKGSSSSSGAPKNSATIHSLSEAREKKRSIRDWTQIVSPLDDRVLIQVESTEMRTPGGLYIPETANINGNYQGAVVAVGRGHRDKKGRVRPLDVQVGDQVLFGQYAGSTIEIDGEELKIVRESEILGTVTK